MRKLSKKIFPVVLAAAFTAPMFAPTSDSLIISPIVAEAKTNLPDSTEKKLTIGSVNIYEFGTIKLHAYNTADPMGDEFYLLESDEGLVLLESGALKTNVEEFNEYIKSLNKPLEGMLLSYHPNGYSTYGAATIYATEGALASWGENGGVRALTNKFVNGFGADKVAADLPTEANIVKVGDTITIAGIEFKILGTADAEGNYAVAIPAINAVYRHMMGSDVHNILPSIEYIDAEIADLKGYLKDGYSLILTSHYKPEDQTAVARKIGYLRIVKGFAKTCKTKEEFINAVKQKFPNYQGDMYLDMTAGFLFK